MMYKMEKDKGGNKMANPTLLTMPLCIDADKNTIPPTDAGISGLFSEQYGWQDINSLPLASGGKAPNRRDFNGVFALLGGIAYACQRGYTFEWVATLDYVVGCVVLDTNDNKRYECIADVSANVTPPSADTTHWKEFGADVTALANTDLSNLTATGLNAFATKTLSNLDTNNLSVHVVVDSYYDDEGNWWRKYSDGWVEQGGQDSQGNIRTITLLKPMANTAYNVMAIDGSDSSDVGHVGVSQLTTTSFRLATTNTASSQISFWRVEGQGANV